MDGSPPIETPPLDAAGFCMALTRLDAPKRLLLAVSGGADSMTMMRLAASLQDRFEFSVASVDHQLRAGARAEAALVAKEAGRHGFDHTVLEWTGEKSSSGLQAAARHARYRLLINHAYALGAEAILTAHNADDQAETVLMRKARGSGVRGLAAMAEKSFIAADAGETILLLRPLLDVRRRDLRNYLEAQGAAFVDDPSNENEAYERVRVRRALSIQEAEGEISVSAICQAARESREEARRIEAAQNDRFEMLDGRFDENGAAHLRAGLSANDAPLIARLIHAVAGGDHAVTDTRCAEALEAALSGRKTTLGGAILSLRGHVLSIYREPATVLGRAGVASLAPLKIAPGGKALWDSRFILANPMDETVIVRPAGAALAGHFPDEEPDLIAAAPALWRDGEILGLAAEIGVSRPLADERFFRRVNRFAEIT